MKFLKEGKNDFYFTALENLSASTTGQTDYTLILTHDQSNSTYSYSFTDESQNPRRYNLLTLNIESTGVTSGNTLVTEYEGKWNYTIQEFFTKETVEIGEINIDLNKTYKTIVYPTITINKKIAKL